MQPAVSYGAEIAVQLLAFEQLVEEAFAHGVELEQLVVTVSEPLPTSGACELTHDCSGSGVPPAHEATPFTMACRAP
jgi:hypothetical protein